MRSLTCICLAVVTTAFLACATGTPDDESADDGPSLTGSGGSQTTSTTSGGPTSTSDGSGGTSSSGTGGKPPSGGDGGSKDGTSSSSSGSGGNGSSSSASSGSGGSAPSGWTCDPLYFGATDGCDCGCGVLDPDCLDALVGSCDYCSDLGSCGLASCPGNIDPVNNATCVPVICGDNTVGPGETCDDGNTMNGDGCDSMCQIEIPSAWTCSSFYYATNDGCDCGCGVVDPDCTDSTSASCDYCQDSGSCGTGACPANINPTNNAVCI